MLFHLFLSYFILANVYFIPSLPNGENRASILFVFYIYFKPIFKQDRQSGVFYLYFFITSWKTARKIGYSVSLYKTVIK